MFLLSEIFGGSDGGWYLGLLIGFVVVVVVVILVAAILTFAQRILEEAQRAVHNLEQASVATQPIEAMTDVNRSAKQILEALDRARDTVERRTT